MGDIRGPVSVHDGIVYAITGEGWVAAYATDSGKLLWSKPLAASYEEGRPLAINNTPPVPTPHGLVVRTGAIRNFSWITKPERRRPFTLETLATTAHLPPSLMMSFTVCAVEAGWLSVCPAVKKSGG